MHAGKLGSSDRLQHTLAVLADGEPHTTWNIARQTRSVAVHSDIAALRANDIDVDCTRRGNVWEYRLVKRP